MVIGVVNMNDDISKEMLFSKIKELEKTVLILKAGIASSNNYMETEDDGLTLDEQDVILLDFYIAKTKL